jgi:DNA topoisomerase-1
MTLQKAIEELEKGGEGPKVLGQDPATGQPVFVKVGRFGPYFQLGEPKEGAKGKKDKPKMASLLAGMTPETATLADALATLALPREVGVSKPKDAEQEEPILAANGRYGPYLKWGKETRSIPAGTTPLTVTMEQALALFAQPKTGRGRRPGGVPQKARKELGEHPETKAPIKLLDGRYGPYVTDGTTNASLQKDENPDELTLARAVELLAARAARGPAKKRSFRRARKATAE